MTPHLISFQSTRILIAYLFLLAYSCSPPLALAHYYYDAWNMDNGLPRNSVRNVAQTQGGVVVIDPGINPLSAPPSPALIEREPVWKRWWFQVFFIFKLIGVGYFISRAWFSRLNRREALQEDFFRRLIAFQERERRRIATELHDSLGQNLLVIKNEALIGLNLTPQDSLAREHLTQISETTSLAIEEIRRIAQNLTPYHLERLGLTSTLEHMTRRVKNSSDIDFSIEIDNVDGVLSKESEVNLYRIVQELISNIIKHSEAAKAWLSIRRTDTGAEIICRDNGKGFDSSAVSNSQGSGLGLTGVGERVRILGGKHSIRSAPGQGAAIVITIAQVNGKK